MLDRYRLNEAMLEYQMYMAAAIEEGEGEILRQSIKQSRKATKDAKPKTTVMKAKKVVRVKTPTVMKAK